MLTLSEVLQRPSTALTTTCVTTRVRLLTSCATGNRKRDVFRALSREDRAKFIDRLDCDCRAAGALPAELTRFRELCDAMADDDAPQWQVLETGQVVLTAKHFPSLTAKPHWDRSGDVAAEDPFPWLRRLESYAPVIAKELREVCDRELPVGYCLGPAHRRSMMRLPGLTETERSIFVPGFDDQQTNGYCHTVLVTNDTPQKVAALFPQTMAALDACAVPYGVRLVAFGKQLPRTALHWHTDGRNFMLTAHLPLAGPSRRTGARTPPFPGPAARSEGPGGRSPFPAVNQREGVAGMILSPLLAPGGTRGRSVRERLVGFLSSLGRGGRRGQSKVQAVSRSWRSTPQDAAPVGTGVVFDTTFMHSAYNDGDVPAEILFIDFWHPELSSAEQTAITCLQRLLREEGEAGGV